MKPALLSLVFVLMLTIPANAQHEHHQQTTKIDKKEKTATPAAFTPVSVLLLHYYNLKNALVAGDAASARANARLLVGDVNSTDHKLLSEANVHILAAKCAGIMRAEDLEQQRTYFASLSANLTEVVKALGGGGTVYVQYCPMKKAGWLSNEADIRNPYYGSEMLTCGRVTETIH